MLTIEYGDVPCIAYQNESYLIAFKPRCMHTDGIEDGTLSSWLISEIPELAEVSPDAGLIQRLDFFTSGLLTAAKTPEAYLALRSLLTRKNIKKSYLILLEGKFEKKISFTSQLGSPYRRSKKVQVFEKQPSRPNRTLEGTTHFTPIVGTKKWSLVEASASLARRHQVRAHAAHLGHPLIGDELYGSTTGLSEFTGSADEGFFLFANKLSIPKIPDIETQSIGVKNPVWLEKLLKVK